MKSNSYKILIEASKLLMPGNDGVKRYVVELLKLYSKLTEQPDNQFIIDLYLYGKIMPLAEAHELIFRESETKGIAGFVEIWAQKIKQTIPFWLLKWYRKSFAKLYNAIVRGIWWLQYLRRAEHAKRYLLDSYDLVHFPLHITHYPFKHIKTNYLTTVHDLTPILFPQFHDRQTPKHYWRTFRFIEKYNSHVLAVSKSTALDFRKQHPKIDKKRVHVVYESADNQLFTPINNASKEEKIRTKYRLPKGEYILCLSTIEPRKNLLNTIKAFLLFLKENPQTNMHLVIAGKYGWKSDQLFENKELISDKIVFTGFVEDVHLPYLYSQARVLSFVSHYEGFGLPILEAMSCGTPVIYGNNSSQKEIAGLAGYPANSNDVNAISAQMKKACFDDNLYAKKVELSLQRASEFSWGKTAKKTLKLYAEIIVAD